MKALQFELERLRWKISRKLSATPSEKPLRLSRVAVSNFGCFVGQPGETSVTTTAEAFPGIDTTADGKALAELLKSHGSDKATRHSYYLAYAGLLANRRAEPLRILEIGIGTNDPNAASSMGAAGRPGASLRAWRDWGPQFDVHGADIDRNILFSEDRIATHWVDQTSRASLLSLEQLGRNSFDLIIDDGLHRPDANLHTLAFALRMLKPGGVFVVEDIIKPLAPFWQAIGDVLADRADTQLLFDRKEALFIVKPKLTT